MTKQALPRLEQIKKVHVIGICGTLMGAFAAYLRRRGMETVGSDQNVYPPMSDVLRDAGVTLYSGYRPENLTAGERRPDLVVIGNVISASNPEARAAIDGGYAYCSLPEAMEQLFLLKTRNIVVSGTHGKTTTSSMLAHTLVRNGRDPSYFIGGVSRDLPFSFHVAGIEEGRPYVLEGDEYDTAFWDKVPKFNHYLPDDVILTSVEYDHADIYPDFAAVMRAFEGLVSRIRPQGRLIACFDYASVRDLASKAKVPVISYGSAGCAGARFTPGRVRVENEWIRFDVLDNGAVVDEVVLGVPGNHNVLNALSVWLECRELGLSSQEIASALRCFQGVRRRQEPRGEVRGVLVIDDFAHHPTAVRETLRALKHRHPKRRLVAVFEPRSATSRRKVFQQEYVEAFKEADAVFVSTPYDQSKISQADQFSSAQLVQDVQKGRPTAAFLMESVELGIKQVSEFSREGDLVAVLSNGGFEGFIPKLLEHLKLS